MSRHPIPADQMLLPFAEKEYVSISRVARILGISISAVYRLAVMPDGTGKPTLTLVDYRKRGKKRVLYSSILNFCNKLRVRHGIEDRRPKLDHPMFRHRDEDLLPFPLSDTIYSAEALSALGYEDIRSLVYLIEEGRFDAYHLYRKAEWRISRSSFARFLETAHNRKVAIIRETSVLSA